MFVYGTEVRVHAIYISSCLTIFRFVYTLHCDWNNDRHFILMHNATIAQNLNIENLKLKSRSYCEIIQCELRFAFTCMDCNVKLKTFRHLHAKNTYAECHDTHKHKGSHPFSPPCILHNKISQSPIPIQMDSV